MPIAPESNHVEEISTNDVRGGVTGNGVRYVLGFSLAGVIIIFVVLYYFL
jgi:hypothetical protein